MILAAYNIVSESAGEIAFDPSALVTPIISALVSASVSAAGLFVLYWGFRSLLRAIHTTSAGANQNGNFFGSALENQKTWPAGEKPRGRRVDQAGWGDVEGSRTWKNNRGIYD